MHWKLDGHCTASDWFVRALQPENTLDAQSVIILLTPRQGRGAMVPLHTLYTDIKNLHKLFSQVLQLLTQEVISAWKHYQLKKSLLPWRWEHLLHPALFFPDQAASGQAQQWSGPVLPNEQFACAGSWWLQQTTFAFLLLKRWPKVIATHPDRATWNDKLGMFLKHFSKQWIKCGISSK